MTARPHPLRVAALIAGALLACTPAAAQDPPRRTPAERQILTDLAYVLGQAHALHRLCAGPQDSAWYNRMQQLMGAETPDPGFRRRLVESFNAGFQAQQAEFPVCSRASQSAERAAATRGAALARALAAAHAPE